MNAPPERSEGQRPNICLVLASKGRPDVVGEALSALAGQFLQPSLVILSVTSKSDILGIPQHERLVITTGEAGLTIQRNAALDLVPNNTDIVAFFDDDFVPHPGWMQSAAQAFQADSSIDGITGNLIADGASGGGGYSYQESLQMIREHVGASSPSIDWVRDNESPYGCNMAFRFSTIKDLKFDERLVLIGWLEDRDFGARVAQRGGRLVKLGTALGVHRGVKAGKVSDVCLGYSQIVNPIYLYGKGSMTARQLWTHLFKTASANLLRFMSAEPHIDRFGRLRGNLRGVADVLRRRVEPERARLY